MSLQETYERPFTHRHGTPMERFMRLVGKTDSCWLWKGTKDHHGYGWFWMWRGRQIRSHRAAWELFRGPILDGLFVCHTCDTPACVNPFHLFLGTSLDNQRDRSSKLWGKRGLAGNPRKYKPPQTANLNSRPGCEGKWERNRMLVCKRGHEFSGENIMKNGHARICRKCYALRATKRKAKRSADRSGT